MSNTISSQKYLNFAIRTAKQAGKLILANYGKKFSIEFKGENPKDLVTAIDKASEKFIIKAITGSFPDHEILSEEGGGKNKSDQSPATKSDFLWVIDPIDGTTNFAHGYSFFAVSIGLLYKGKPLVGVIYAPMLKELFYAQKGGGAYLNGDKIRVSKVKSLQTSLLSTGFAYNNWAANMPHFEYFLNESQGIRRGGSAALDLCHIAAGRLDGYWEYKLKPWDIAAGVLIVTEAGGKVTSLDGSPLDLYSQKILATNSLIHSSMATHFKQSPKTF